MKEQLMQIKEQVNTALAQATTAQELEELRIRFLGKKGELTAILKQMGSLSAEERPVIGQLANEVRTSLEESFAKNIVNNHDGQIKAFSEDNFTTFRVIFK